MKKILLPAPAPSSLTTRYFIPENLGVLDTFAIRVLVQSDVHEGHGSRLSQLRPSSSTSKISVELGGIAPLALAP